MERHIKVKITVLALADATAKLLPLLTFPLITRTLGPEMYGKYGFAMSVVGFVLLFASPGFTNYGLRAAAQDEDGAKRLASRITGLRLLFSVAAFLGLCVYLLVLAPPDREIRILSLAAALMLLPNALNLDWLLTGAGAVVPVAIANIVAQFVYTAAIVTFLRSAADAWIVPAASFAGAVVALAITYRAVVARFGLSRPAFTAAEARDIVPTSLLLGFASLMSMTYDKIDAVMLGYYKPMEEVGVYTATYRLMWLVMSFLPILSTVFFPLVAKAVAKDPTLGDRDSEMYLKMFFATGIPLVAGGILVSGPMTSFLMGKDYGGSGLVFALLLPNVLLGGLASYYCGMRLVALNRNRQYVVAVMIGAILNVAVNLYAIPRWGSVGAALTTCMSQAAVAAAAAWYGREHPGPSLARAAAVPAAASAVMAVALACLMFARPGLHVLILVPAGAVGYVAAWGILRRGKWTTAT